MYVPPAFAVDSPEAIRALIATYNFATLVSQGPGGLMATHVPVLFEPGRGSQGTLVTHLAGVNPHARAMDGAEILTIFQGPHGYVSPSLYATHPSVPTWNYTAVHVYGRASLVTDPQSLRAMLETLVARHEAGRETPWSMDGLQPGYVDGMLRRIVGIEIEVSRIESKHKLSQNRSRVDRTRVIEALNASASAHERELGAYMNQHAPIS
ncbi:MAG: FMN-binding negative transcriptional regulator [Alphaproteobacteria bacterium]|nr:FMN-binding negative transcriptional regulator [Alphaproteobacteria bacterium]